MTLWTILQGNIPFFLFSWHTPLSVPPSIWLLTTNSRIWKSIFQRSELDVSLLSSRSAVNCSLNISRCICHKFPKLYIYKVEFTFFPFKFVSSLVLSTPYLVTPSYLLSNRKLWGYLWHLLLFSPHRLHLLQPHLVILMPKYFLKPQSSLALLSPPFSRLLYFAQVNAPAYN